MYVRTYVAHHPLSHTSALCTHTHTHTPCSHHTHFSKEACRCFYLSPPLRSTQTLHLTEVLRFEVTPTVQLLAERHKHTVQHSRKNARVLVAATHRVRLARVGHSIAEEETVLPLQKVLHTNQHRKVACKSTTCICMYVRTRIQTYETARPVLWRASIRSCHLTEHAGWVNSYV